MRLRTVYLLCILTTVFLTLLKVFYDKGFANASLACSKSQTQQVITEFSRFIEVSKHLMIEAQHANKLLSEQMAVRIIADEETTKEIRHAVTKNSNRIRYQFDADVMRQLADARERANLAATRGISHSVSADSRAGE